jgi:hypothetical protein
MEEPCFGNEENIRRHAVREDIMDDSSTKTIGIPEANSKGR